MAKMIGDVGYCGGRETWSSSYDDDWRGSIWSSDGQDGGGRWDLQEEPDLGDERIRHVDDPERESDDAAEVEEERAAGRKGQFIEHWQWMTGHARNGGRMKKKEEGWEEQLSTGSETWWEWFQDFTELISVMKPERFCGGGWSLDWIGLMSCVTGIQDRRSVHFVWSRLTGCE